MRPGYERANSNPTKAFVNLGAVSATVSVAATATVFVTVFVFWSVKLFRGGVSSVVDSVPRLTV